MKQNTKNWTAKEENKKEPKPGVTKMHNLIIVDESGSMRMIYNAALNGMNKTIKAIRQAAKDYEQQEQEVTLVTFDSNHYNEIFSSVPAQETRELTRSDYNPYGCTPLYDAMGRALTELEKRVKENEGVLVTVITDGLENASCEFTLAEIRALVERLDSAGWVFTYIGANQDSAAVGNTMGIVDTMNFEATEEDTARMWEDQCIARDAFFSASTMPDFDIKTYKRGKFFKRKS